MIDVCIISDGKTKELRDMTQRCIDGAKEAGPVYVSDVKSLDYKGAYDVSIQGRDFNYNKELNKLAYRGINKYIAFCNNDLVFKKGWSKEILHCMKKVNAVSASPWCPVAHRIIHGYVDWRYRRGYNTRRYLAGWCFVMRRDYWEKIGGLPEDYNFFCADNAVEKQLRKDQAIHILCRYAEVTHLGSKTSATIDKDTLEDYTKGCVKQWNRDNGENKFGWGV